MLIHEMLVGVTPFANYRDPKSVLQYIDASGVPPLKKKLLSATGRDFVNQVRQQNNVLFFWKTNVCFLVFFSFFFSLLKCLAIDVSKRPSASELLEHAWFEKTCPKDGACIVKCLEEFRKHGVGGNPADNSGGGCLLQ